MAESGGLFVIDGEDAGATPWEFDAIYTNGPTLALSDIAEQNGTYGYLFTGDGANRIGNGRKGFVDKTEIYVRVYFYIPDTSVGVGSYSRCTFISLLDVTNSKTLIAFGPYWHADTTITRWGIGSQVGATDLTTTTNFSLNARHMVELRYVSHAATGGYEVWIDGDTFVGSSDIDQDTSSWTCDAVVLGSQQDYSYAFGNGSVIYLDDLKADTSPVGAYSDSGGGTGPWVLVRP